jgi:hypothetical protein
MGEIGALLAAIGLICVIIVALIAVIIYSVRLQRRAVITQTAVVDDHFSEKAQRQRHLELAEEALQLQRQASAHDEEARSLMRRAVELNEEILKVLRSSRT